MCSVHMFPFLIHDYFVGHDKKNNFIHGYKNNHIFYSADSVAYVNFTLLLSLSMHCEVNRTYTDWWTKNATSGKHNQNSNYTD